MAAPDRCWAGTGCSKLPGHGSESSGKNRSLPHFCSVMCAVIWMLYASLCFVMGTLATCGPLRANVPRHGWCRVCLAMVSSLTSDYVVVGPPERFIWDEVQLRGGTEGCAGRSAKKHRDPKAKPNWGIIALITAFCARSSCAQAIEHDP